MADGELDATTDLRRGDRRPVTILFTDIVGSTVIAERLDPEEWREVVSGAHRRVSEAVVRYEGMIAQLLGDGVLAFFGAPAAHEDDPVRAVQAALDIQAAMAEYAHELAGYVDGFAMRIGIHTGEVVFGAVGAAGHVEYLALGDAVNLAARLQSAAAAGGVLVSASTARLVRGAFVLASGGEITVKGKATPVSVYEVRAARPAAARTRGLLPQQAGEQAPVPATRQTALPLGEEAGVLRVSPLVGRTSELAALSGALEALSRGHGGIVALLGEAGIGKSRLVEEAHAWAGANLGQPPRWLEGRALSYGAGLSYWTIGQLIKADLGLSDGDPEVRARVALRRRLNGLALTPELAEAGPYLAHLLGLHLEGEAAGRLAALDSETLKYQLLVSIRRYFAALAAGQPVALVCEDLHWADPSTLDVLAELMALTDHLPVVLLLVTRIEREHGSWRLKQRAETEYSHRYTEITLRPLAAGDAQRMVDHLLQAHGLPEPLHELLLARAEGNPFFLEELVAALVEQGALARDGDTWRLQGPAESLSIPETVQGVILARIDRLEADVRDTLQMASVIGRSFLYRLLQAIGEAERQLDRHLVILQRADLVREKAVRPELEYIFKHSLAQETAYHALLLERRREFHRRVGEALQGLYAGREQEIYGLLAHHFDLAEQPEPAVRYLTAAGEKARLEDALAEAAGFYRRAVERLEAAGDADGAARAWLKLALVHQADFAYAAAHEAYERGFAWQQRAPGRARRPPEEGATLRRSQAFPVHTLDPGKWRLDYEGLLVGHLFAGLAEVDAELNVVPHAARSWEVLDEGRCWRIYLRGDVRWTDGSPVTAHDYVYAWLRMPGPGAGDCAGHLLPDVAGAWVYGLEEPTVPGLLDVRALDDLVLEVRLEQPVPWFPYLLALSETFPLPRQVVERWGDAWWQPEHILSNGPFRLSHFRPDHVVLEHNPLYFGGGTGNLARVEYIAIPDNAERLARFASGELDQAACLNVPDDLAACCQDPPLLTTFWCALVPQPPFDAVPVRRAIAMALNWGSQIERFGMARATGGLVPPGMPGHTPGLALSYDPAQAGRLLAEAGYPQGRQLPSLGIETGFPEVAAMARQLWRAALPEAVELRWFERSKEPPGYSGAQLVFLGWSPDVPDPDSVLRGGALPLLRRAGWQDPELDALLQRAAHTLDRAGRLALYRTIDRRLVAEQALFVPISYQLGQRELNQPWVHGPLPNKMGGRSLRDTAVDRHAAT